MAFESYIATMQEKADAAAAGAGARFNNDIAAKTSWGPLVASLGPELGTYALAETTGEGFRLAQKRRPMNLAFFAAGLFMAFKAVGWENGMPVVHGVAGLALGGFFILFGFMKTFSTGKPVVFNTITGTVTKKGQDYPLSRVRGFQILNATTALSSLAARAPQTPGGGDMYQANIVLDDATRFSLMSCKSIDALRADIGTLAASTGKPVWDLTAA